ncbi:MAG: DUF3368 domain-containing protein [Hormoscilla sp. SP5CHS1]|nr:DUF3368 domain-containing protein [Hormoscilla sp. SP12CHS1]MBC6455086.1 DUF3368 domain-containing protein [Hormoscilla sp. SP5CHS1]
MVERIAVNSSPLILLTEVGFLNFLQLVSEEVVVPTAVVTEIQQYGEIVRAIAQTDWLVVTEIPPAPEPIESRNLGAGESAVLAWGYFNPGREVILDDLAARRCAINLGIPVRGTVSLVIIAKQRGEIPAARPVLEGMRDCGLYLSDRLFYQTLTLVGE